MVKIWLAHLQKELQIHEITANVPENTPKVVLNLTPDSYNALVSIYHVIAPDSGPKFAQFLFEEKESILR